MSCNCTGNCSCSTIVIPIGPQGPQGIQGIQGIAGPTGPQGPIGPQGNTGTTTVKYANTFTTEIPITISKAAIISCGPLISTCVSTPQDYDFTVTVWKQNGSQWQNVTFNTLFIISINYDTAGNVLTIVPATLATYRVIVMG